LKWKTGNLRNVELDEPYSVEKATTEIIKIARNIIERPNE